jgi:hypothetical protein
MASREGFARIQKDHIEQACRALLSSGAGGGGSYFVRWQDRELPAKRVLKEAYQLANGVEVSSRDFSGGTYTQRILERLGFDVVVRGAERSKGD